MNPIVEITKAIYKYERLGERSNPDIVLTNS
jgi:hypothetical protein